MYVVMTVCELRMHCGLGEEVCDSLGWDQRDLWSEYSGVSHDVIDQFEICIPGSVARRMGILSPRGEKWIERYLHHAKDSAYYEAIALERELPRPGEAFVTKLVSDIDPQKVHEASRVDEWPDT